MQKYLPLFPLNLIVYPYEKLNLHIFEPRYKELINETIENQSTFGIPTFLNDKIAGFGTELATIKIYKKYDDGRMDVETEGLRIFKMLGFDNPSEGKLYAGGLVEIVDNKDNAKYQTSKILNEQVGILYKMLQVKVDVNPAATFLSYQYAHKIGLSPEQEYELLCIDNEQDRQLFLIDHLQKTIPIIKEIERTKQIIKMNGHFKFLDPLKF